MKYLSLLVVLIATSVFSQDIKPDAVLMVMKKVADWQLANPSKHGTTDWTQGAGYAGIMALAGIADTSKYEDEMLAMGRANHWQLGKRVYHADDHCIGQTYVELFLKHHDPAMIASMRQQFDDIMAHPKDDNLDFTQKSKTDRWSWCDSLFMAPPAWACLAKATGEKKYLDFANRLWWVTSDYLYDKEEHLYFRDSTYFKKREANGKKVFWSRGNGWVMSGLVRMLQYLPTDYPNRAKYVQQFQQMADKLLACQQPDGLWRSSLLDPANYPLKETSGSGFYCYALTWGINNGLLDRAKFEPAIRKAWAALVACVGHDGKLTHVQPIGADPKKFDADSTEIYGVGAFLLAGSEMYRLVSPQVFARFVPERMDDFAWENDCIAFRMYGPALQNAPGEVSGSGVDVWCKRTRNLIINKWYKTGKYHEDHGEGCDCYKVGTARGCGGTGIWKDGKLWTSRNFVTWKLVSLEPMRVTFELTYAPWDAGGVKVSEVKRITLDAGSQLNRMESTFTFEGNGELTVAAGLAIHKGGQATVRADDRWASVWEPTDGKNNGMIGVGLLLPAGVKAEFKQTADHALALTTVKSGQPFVYYAGAGWSKSGFADKTAWEKYLAAFKGETP